MVIQRHKEIAAKMDANAEIIFDVRGGVAFITLNRPKALNALTLDMIRELDRQLVAWRDDPAVHAMVIEGAGERAFCAGGDVRAVWQAGKNGDPMTADFFREEYQLNQRIKFFPKPYVALINGIAMGGGVGISIHGSHRIVTDNTLFAMPETGIGLFPDVGGSYFLPRLPGQLGMYLALTGARLGPADCIYAGLVTEHVPQDKLMELKAALVNADWVSRDAQAIVDDIITAFADDPGKPPLAEHRDVIDRCFAGETVEDILVALEKDGGDWAAKCHAKMARLSPTSMKITLRQIRQGATMEFDQAMIMEYRLSQACMAGHDFYEGIRAVLVDKDNTPAWQPATLSGVTPEAVAAHFKSLGSRDLVFD